MTVGAGTAGDKSFLAEGLSNTIRLLEPRQFWLVPSASKESIAVADYVRDLHSARFARWSSEADYKTIDNPDDMFSCRTVVESVLHSARLQLAPGEKLLLNPTSGTKQMSIGASLAGVAAGVDTFEFTVGDRKDGVVQTGSERIVSLSTDTLFFERDLRTAAELFKRGDYRGAATLMKRHSNESAKLAEARSEAMFNWMRMDYASAIAAGNSLPERSVQRLQTLAKSNDTSIVLLGDMVASADAIFGWDEYDEALARYYRVAEQAAKTQLAVAHRIVPPYIVSDILKLSLPECLARNISARAYNSRLSLGLELSLKILDAKNDKLVPFFSRDGLWDKLQRRNETIYGHGRRSVGKDVVLCVRKNLKTAISTVFPDIRMYWSLDVRPNDLLRTQCVVG